MPSVLSDKNGALMTTSPTTMHTESLKTKKKKNIPAPIVPKCLIFLVKGKAT